MDAFTRHAIFQRIDSLPSAALHHDLIRSIAREETGRLVEKHHLDSFLDQDEEFNQFVCVLSDEFCCSPIYQKQDVEWD